MIPTKPNQFNTNQRDKQREKVRAPGDRYQEVETILTKGGAPRIHELWQHLHQEEHRLWPNWLIGKYTP
jgi:hypothetical protein